ncbi:MAG: hypothetical protein M5U08_25780 [Burkholderiales bacterium]|nr:hypothetical protein [Burkholderiales bacterium]
MKKGESVPLYEVEELQVERRLRPDGRRRDTGKPTAANAARDERVVKRFGRPGRRETDLKR